MKKADNWLKNMLGLWFFAYLCLILLVYALLIGYQYEGKTLYTIMFN